MFFIAGITIALFIQVLLIAKKNKSQSDNILAMWIFLIIIHLCLFYIFYTGKIRSYSFLWGVEIPIPLLQSVMLYLYAASVTNQLPQKRKLILLHFIPAAAMYIYLIPFFMLPAEQKAFVYKNRGAGFEVFNIIRIVLTLFSGIFYVTWSSLLLKKHRQKILNQFSYQDKINLRWLQILTAGMGVIWLLIFFSYRNGSITFVGVVLFVFLIGYFGIRQVKIFTEEKELPEEAKKEKYSKSGLTEETSERLYKELLNLMLEECMYRKSDLSINDLAVKLNVHPNYLSQIINEKEEKNFYEFVNHYRVEEFRKLISDPKNQNLTLLSLAFDCGFNSKSSFNRHFKKITGQTPSQYYINLKKGNSTAI